MLPPNLTRHFWEARRTFLRSAGKDVEPWFQLTPASRAVAESEVELFRQAIRTAEEEQDLLATLDAPVPPAVDAEPAPNAPEDCDCPGCSAVAAFLRLLAGSRMPVAPAGTAAAPLKVVPFGLLPLLQPTREPLSTEELAYIENAARAAVDSWIASGKPVKAAVPPEPASTTWMFGSVPFPTGLNTLKRPNSIPEEAQTAFWESFRPVVTTEP
ncbi:hypothetical protein OG345_42215 (plasmid) [Streptomyces sp. NBC_01220]|uniref:hypothetical protein n=1 Tax=Streptomyces sp. NBC_01220 TaxID=2903781 RepID=UPI00352CF018|nr:hypothetical protein OG345_42215 [Streptomyces sp. NBC_01220]